MGVNLMNKKGSEEAISTIKKMILALIILVVLILIFSSSIRRYVSGIWTTFEDRKEEIDNDNQVDSTQSGIVINDVSGLLKNDFNIKSGT